MIDQTKERISAMRNEIDQEYDVWYEDASRLATLLGTSISMPRLPLTARQRSNAPSTSRKEYYLRNLTIPLCDHLSSDFQSRFNSENRKGVGILALLPAVITDTANVQNVVGGLMFWAPDIPHASSLRAEVKEWQRHWNAIDDLPSAMSLVECLQFADGDISPNIRALLMIGCILPVTSCEAEHSFSCLRRVKTCLRSRMGEGRLSGLILMHMNHSMVIDTQAICEMFIQRHNRKMFSKCILYA